MQRVNRSLDVARRGGNIGSGGWTKLEPRDIWYCGKNKNECLCGSCDGRCGPTNGCPCQDCFQLLVDDGKVKFNKIGEVARKGGPKGRCGGWTMLDASEVWYCGQRKNECRCGMCDVRCGPTDGCPCQDCFQLLVDEGKVKLNRSGDVATKGGSEGGKGGWTMMEPKQVWYCGKRKNECKCGSCDGRCGPTNGCPCRDCFQLLVDEGTVKLNRSGNVIWKGANGGSGGWTGLQSQQIWYCGQRKNACRCGGCDGRCGPTNGCPCNDCFQLLVDEGSVQLVPDRSASPSSAWQPVWQGAQSLVPHRVAPALHPGPVPAGPALPAAGPPPPAAATGDERRLECKICLAEEVQAVLVPCGHLCACWPCSQRLSTCPLCRTAVHQRIRTYV